MENCLNNLKFSLKNKSFFVFLLPYFFLVAKL